jgi:hypothetical protein
MTLDATKVRIAVTGAISKAATSATAPTGTAGTLTGFTDLGYISEDGIEIELPGSGDTEPVRAWQNNTTVRTIRTPSDDLPSWHFTMIETKLETIETYFGVTVTTGASEGSFSYTVTNRPTNSYAIDVVDGAELIRDYIPRGVVSEVGAHTFSNGEPTGYEVTIEGEYDAVKLYNFRRWSTSLKT